MTQCVSINNWPSLSAFSYRETFIQKREAQNSLEIRNEKSIHGAKTIEKKVERNHAQDWPHLSKDWTFLTWLLFHLLTCHTFNHGKSSHYSEAHHDHAQQTTRHFKTFSRSDCQCHDSRKSLSTSWGTKLILGSLSQPWKVNEDDALNAVITFRTRSK